MINVPARENTMGRLAVSVNMLQDGPCSVWRGGSQEEAH